MTSGGVTARDEVLGRVRAALGELRGTLPGVPRSYHGAGAGPVDLDLLVDRLRDYHALVRTNGDGHTVAGLLADAVRERGARSFVVPAGVPPAWLEALGSGVLVDDGTLTPVDLDAVDGVVTGCALAIAETGTIVLDASADQGRRLLSLVPDYHLCVVREEDVVATVPDAVARLDPTRPLTWISGPSATSDIELERVEGVHGPRTLEVILVPAAADPRPPSTPGQSSEAPVQS
ncbi:MAG: LUD domain-containing protein [Nocardioidaceae bacterium]|nr:LUD domain-containing protein [Nocardioidaceae bacterium]